MIKIFGFKPYFKHFQFPRHTDHFVRMLHIYDIGTLNAKVVSFADATQLYSKISYVEDYSLISIVYMTG